MLRAGRVVQKAHNSALPHTLARLLVERITYKVNSFQLTRSDQVVLALPE